MKKQQYAFSVAASSAGAQAFSRAPRRDESDDEGTKMGDDTFVNNYFDTKRDTKARFRMAEETDYDFRDDEELDNFSRAGSSTKATTKQVHISSGFLKHKRPKPDLGMDDDENDDLSRIRGVPVHLPAKAPAKDLPPRVSKRQKELERIHALGDDEEKRMLQTNRKFELARLERVKSQQDEWMRKALEGAKRSFDDRAPRGGTAILRKDVMADAAPEHTTGRRIRHNQFLHFDGSFYAGRFYLDPQGSKPNETCTRDMTLILYVDKTGPEGLLLRIDKKYYELFEGDIGFVQSESVYSIVNPSRNSKCSVTYTLVANPAEEEDEQDLGEEEDVREVVRRKPQGVPTSASSGQEDEKDILEYELAWKKARNEAAVAFSRRDDDEEEDDRRSDQ